MLTSINLSDSVFNSRIAGFSKYAPLAYRTPSGPGLTVNVISVS